MSFPTHSLLKTNMALNSARGKEEPKADKNSLKSTLAPRSKHHSYSEKRRSNYNHHHPKKTMKIFFILALAASAASAQDCSAQDFYWV